MPGSPVMLAEPVTPLTPPSIAEIERWRDVVFYRYIDDEEQS